MRKCPHRDSTVHCRTLGERVALRLERPGCEPALHAPSRRLRPECPRVKDSFSDAKHNHSINLILAFGQGQHYSITALLELHAAAVRK